VTVDETETPPTDDSNAGQGNAPPVAAAAAPWRARLKKWAIISGITAVIAPILILVAWTAITLSYTYSNGYRAGYVQKISKKGWICPTWEGELQMTNLPGSAQEKWTFTVRDDIVAASVRSSIGHRVALEYEEHRGVPSSCFGETQYYVIGVRQVAEP